MPERARVPPSLRFLVFVSRAAPPRIYIYPAYATLTRRRSVFIYTFACTFFPWLARSRTFRLSGFPSLFWAQK